MFLYSRIAEFDLNDLKYLEDLNFEEIQIYIKQRKVKEKLVINIQKEIDKLKRHYYSLNDRSNLKKWMKVSESTNKKLKSSKKINYDTFMTKKIKIFIEEYNNIIKTEKEMLKKFDNLLNNAEKYKIFIKNENFKKYIYETNPSAYRNIIDINNQKKSFRKNRYLYIQRNIVKTNGLSYMGISHFKSDEESLKISNAINPYYLTSLLKTLAYIPKYRVYIKFYFSPFVYRDKYLAYLQRQYFINRRFKGYFVRENLLFHNDIVDELKKLSLKEFKDLRELSRELGEKRFKFFLSQDLINIDYNNTNIFNLVLENKELSSLKPNSSFKNVLSFNGTDILSKDIPAFFKRDIEKILTEEPFRMSFIGVNSVDGYTNNILENENFDKKIVDEFLELNNNYFNYINSILFLKKKNPNLNFLEILCELESIYIYKNNYWNNNEIKRSDIKFKCHQKKSCSIFYNLDDNGQIYYNNIFPGGGFLLGREIKKMTDSVKGEMHDFIKRTFLSDNEIYELVIDETTTSTICTGYSDFKKIYWPYDIPYIDILEINGEITFLFNNKPINIVYMGSIPIDLFQGTKSILLQLISPWKMKKNQKENISKLNNREEIIIHYSYIESLISNNDETLSLINLIEYFNVKQWPINFFMKSKDNPFHKPIFITLLNKEAVQIFLETIKKSPILITEQSPNINNYTKRTKLIEHINHIVMEEV
ncbi:hypothetical protein O0A17_07515 [Staphylococcus pseudintermedius]|nr:hypothetical protein [Staphylococcus pseudintermedius]